MSGNRSKSAFFEGGVGWVTLSADYRGKEASPTNHCWYRIDGRPLGRFSSISSGVKKRTRKRGNCGALQLEASRSAA